MFHVTVNVVQARQHGCTVSVTSPVDNHSTCEINLGLVMQYHFVGLDKQGPVVPPNDDSPSITNHHNMSNFESLSLDLFSNSQSGDQFTSDLCNPP